jgi:type IX secretion system PorP/SprF family membrane protein
MKKKLIVSALAVFMAIGAMAQEFPIYNQYHFHYYLMNPALAGAVPCSHIMATHKQQWTGIKDAPQTQILSFQTRTQGNVGIGAYFFNDKNGYSYQQGGQISIAYHIPMSKGNRYTKSPTLDRQLSFAVSGKFYRYDLDEEVVNQANNEGENIQQTDGVYPNANFGVFFKSYQFFTGLSITNLIPIRIDMFGDSEPLRPLSFFYQLGYAIPTSRDAEIEPSLIFKMDADSRKQMDLNLRYIQHLDNQDMSWWVAAAFKQNLDVGIGQSLVLVPSVNARFGKLRIGYAFNLDLSKLVSYNYGSHEIMMGYSFCHTKEFCR